MTHTYNVTGMTCSGCQAKVQGLLSQVKGVKKVHVDLAKSEAIIDMDQHVPTAELYSALKDYPKYQLSESNVSMPPISDSILPREEPKSWLSTYKPILLIFGYILVITALVEFSSGTFLWERWMQNFMAGFFIIFSFFKLLDLSGFADSYSTYDIIAKRWRPWGYVYAFIELTLGIAFLTGFQPILTNAITFIIMSISSIGVLQSVLNKRKIRCACLGAVFNLPMSMVTIIEDALMIAMSAIMLIHIINA